MNVFIIESKGLATPSYLHRPEDEAVVINFPRDAEVCRQPADCSGALAQGLLLPRVIKE